MEGRKITSVVLFFTTFLLLTLVHKIKIVGFTSLFAYPTSVRRKLVDLKDGHTDIGICEEENAFGGLLEEKGDEFERVLVIGKLCEQLTKSRKHFAELMAFAKATNRTLVLPRCDAGHIGSGMYYKQSICIYFDLKKIGEYVPWISEDVFLRRVEDFERKFDRKPQVYSVYFKWAGQPCDPLAMFSKAKYPYKNIFPNRNISMGFLEEGKYVCSENCPMNSSLPSPLSLLTDEFARNADVLIVGKTSPNQCFNKQKEALKYLEYSPKLLGHVDKFVDAKLGGRFLSIHWRMEMMMWRESTRRSFDKCAKGLIETAQQLVSAHNLTGVFMASDVSPDNMIHSTSMGLGDGARKRLVSVVQAVHKALNPAVWKDFDPSVPKLDSGVQGILDKHVCSRAYIFVYAPNSCFGYKYNNFIPSSYTQEIVDIRMAQGWKANHSHPWRIQA